MVRKMVGRESKTKGKAVTRKVQFEYPSPEAKEVYLAGEFNNWDTHGSPMKKDKNGVWKTTLSLKPGRYEYRLFADGSWENAPSCSGCVPNEFGTQNCVIIIE